MTDNPRIAKTSLPEGEKRLQRIVKALGLNPDHVKRESVTLKPLPDGAWLIEWAGVGILPAEELAEILVADVQTARAQEEALAAAFASIKGDDGE